MLWFILIGIVAYVIADAFFDVSDKISKCVRGAWGGARGAAKDAPPATAKPIDWGAGFKRLLDIIKNIIGFAVRYWQIIAVLIVVLVAWTVLARVWSFVSCPFGGALYCFTDKDDDAALANAQMNTRVAQLEASVGALSGQLAENTSNDRRRVDRVIAQANEGITDAVEAGDPDQLYSEYQSHYSSVWDDLATGEPNPPAGRSAPVRGLDASPV